MDKEKQIEELRTKLRAYAYDLNLNDNDDCRRVAEFIVETLHYRKTEEVTLKLDLGDRTPEEIKQIAEHFSKAMSETPVVSLTDNEIRKQAVMGFAGWVKEMIYTYAEISNDTANCVCQDIDELLKEKYGK